MLAHCWLGSWSWRTDVHGVWGLPHQAHLQKQKMQAWLVNVIVKSTWIGWFIFQVPRSCGEWGLVIQSATNIPCIWVYRSASQKGQRQGKGLFRLHLPLHFTLRCKSIHVAREFESLDVIHWLVSSMKASKGDLFGKLSSWWGGKPRHKPVELPRHNWQLF